MGNFEIIFRELALQIEEQFRVFGRSINLKVSLVIGGGDIVGQMQELVRDRPHVIIATPGRLSDLFEKSPVELIPIFSRIKFLVLDEADRLFEPSYSPQLENILNSLESAKKFQFLIYSATMNWILPPCLKLDLADQNKTKVVNLNPQNVEGKSVVPKQLKQLYLFIPARMRYLYLSYLLKTLYSSESIFIMIFVGKCKTAETLNYFLQELGLKTTALHSQLPSQAHRKSALAKFKSGYVRICIATDVASRGLDIPEVELVINYDIPLNPKDYIHRIGRTARSGKSGTSLSLISQFDIEKVHRIEDETQIKLQELSHDEGKVLELLDEASKAFRASLLKLSENDFGKRTEINKSKKK